MVRTLFVIFLFGILYGKTVYPPLHEFDHPVSTTCEEAQKAFNRGLIAIYAFNYDEAFASFKKASELDPQLAMAYWGMSYSLEEAEKNDQSLPYFQKANDLKKNATTQEQDYIDALGQRFPKKSKVNKHIAYRDAMKRLHEKYPDDPDASVLYAESLMNLLRWHLWNDRLEPVDSSVHEILAVLESVLRRVPFHPGADHFYIHSVEGSKHPEWGLPAAEHLKCFEEWGHLLHSSSHIYLRVGDYAEAVAANLNAIKADERYLHDVKAAYGTKYLTHSLFYLYKSYLWQEMEKESYETATKLVDFVSPHMAHMPQLEENLLVPLDVLLYFHEWDAILKMPEPGAECKLTRAFYHFARARAFLAGEDIDQALKEERAFLKLKEGFKYNKTLEMAAVELHAAVIKAKGNCKSYFKEMQKVIALEDEMGILDWYHQNRQTLGAALLQEGRAVEAETIFRDALQRVPRNGRSLFGLSQALKAQNKDSYWVEREAAEALKNSKQLSLKDL